MKIEEHILYRHFDIFNNLLYVGISNNHLARLSQHKCSAWFTKIQTVTLERFVDRESCEIAEVDAINKEKPLYNIQHSSHYKERMITQEHYEKEFEYLELMVSLGEECVQDEELYNLVEKMIEDDSAELEKTASQYECVISKKDFQKQKAGLDLL